MKSTYKIALLMIVALAVWMLSGVMRSPDHAAGKQGAEQVTESSRALTKVRVRHIQAEQQHTEVLLRGRTEVKRVVDVKAETDGRLVRLLVDKGQTVKTGDVLCELAENGRRAQLAQAQAAHEKASIDYAGAQKLKQNGLLSETQIAASKAAVESSRAALELARLEVEHLQIRAPFDGVVEDHPFEVGTLMERGAICVRLMDPSTMLASAQASEREVLLLALGNPALVRLLSGEQLQGNISFLGRVADPQTRTYRVEVTLETAGQALRDGITSNITIPVQTVMAHHISPAVLALDDSGNVGVRTVGTDQRVEFHPVNVVKETADGVWITGLPSSAELITVGQEYVATGDKVDAVPEDQPAGTAAASAR